ncbi:MAG TPA: urease accessory protein UreD [Burkholderiales bacterium]|nr:urease accessory protein UreD [Burkholderiales bacterium]
MATSWRAQLALEFERDGRRTVLAKRASDGPLVVQKPLYPEGEEVCHAIVVHPPGGIAGGDELTLEVKSEGHALLTTPGAAKWYRSAGPWARQKLVFDVKGTLEWLPRETIVFNAALAELDCEIRLRPGARYIGWEIVCLGRTGSGEQFDQGILKAHTRVSSDNKLLWLERGELDGGGALLRSAVGLGGHSVFGTLLAASPELDSALLRECRKTGAAVTLVPGVLIARYLGNSTEEAMAAFTRLWRVLRPALAGRQAIEPRSWRT